MFRIWVSIDMKRNVTMVLLPFGIALFVVGFFMTFWTDALLQQGSYIVKAGDTLELSWYLQEGDRTEGFFTVSGGNEEASLSIKNPSGEIIYNWYAKKRHDNGFTAQDAGVYTMIFKNLDDANDEIIGVHFRSPYEPRITLYDKAGLLIMIVSVVILSFSICSFKKSLH